MLPLLMKKNCVWWSGLISVPLVKMPNINFLRKITFRNCPDENLKFTRWLMKLGLLASSKKCPSCYHGMRLKPPYGEKEAAWLCRDICHGGKSISKSIRCGSIFQGSHVKLSIWMHFIFRFAQGLHLRQVDMLQEGITGSSASLTKLAHVLRKVCKAAVQRMRRRGKQIVGRRGEIVLIDESKFGHKRKYNRGRTSSRNSWVFGILGIKEQRRRPILKIVPHRSTDHLIPQIKRHVRHGSSIVYRCLTTVNHKENFVDPQTGAHTQNIERLWGVCKSTIWRLRGNRTESMLKDHLDVIEWTYWRGNHHENGPLGMLLHDIRKAFPV